MKITEQKDKHLYRRQFVLGPSFLPSLPSWQQTKLNASFCLSTHPDLEVTQARKGDLSLCLIGYILDPAHPERTNIHILQALLEQPSLTRGAVFEETAALTGRWILIFSDQKGSILFHDAAGLRQVFYATGDAGSLWCASQPSLIAAELGLQMDEAAEAFLQSPAYRGLTEPWWPGNSSPYARVKHLLPNHCLDMQSHEVRRYWPVAPLPGRSLKEAAEEGAAILRSSLLSGHNRFELALPLTAGWDSRVLLAATKDMAKEVFYYTLQYHKMKLSHEDIQIPNNLLSRFNLQHHILPCPGSMTPAFESMYMSNVSNAHESWGIIAEGLFNHYPEQKVCLKGSVSEIARNFYNDNGRIIPDEAVDANRLSALCWMGNDPFVLRHFEAWLEGARPAAHNAGIHLLDLFYWEQRVGNWQAASQLEWDLVQEAFTPYNCRNLLTVLLSADASHRLPPHYQLYEQLARELWPETLSEPVNPSSVNRKRFTGFIKLLLKKTHLFPLYQKYKDKKKRQRVKSQ